MDNANAPRTPDDTEKVDSESKSDTANTNEAHTAVSTEECSERGDDNVKKGSDKEEPDKVDAKGEVYSNEAFSDSKDDKRANGTLTDTGDEVDFIKRDFTVASKGETTGGAELANPIDLVLQEIGVEDSDDGVGERRDSKKLAFASDPNSAEAEKDKDESCSNPIFRYKVLDTIFLFWNTTTMGWVYGQMGPALPDLQLIAGVPLQQATWLFTGFAIGYLGGCLLAGLIQDKFNPRMMLFLYTLGTGITIGMLPWVPIFVVMVVIRVLNGICIGGQDTGIHSMLFALWAHEGGPFIQMTHVLSALGGILSPLVTQPFVSKPSGDVPSFDANTSYNGNGTTLSTVTDNSTVSGVSSTATSPSPLSVLPSPETDVQYAFLITGFLLLTAALPFLVAFLQKRVIKRASRQYSSESVDKNKLPKPVKQIILGILLTNSFVATAYIDLFPSFLTTFVMGQMQWTQKSASSLTSLFFGMYAIGNFIGVFILAYITSTKLITFSYLTSGVSVTGILLSVLFEHEQLVWVTVAISGVTMSGILPTLFTWTQENVTPITARMASALLVSGSAGVMVNPLLLGYMMDVYSPMWFIYLSLGETVLCALLFTAAFVLSRRFSAKRTKKPEVSALKKDIKPEEGEEASESKLEMYPRGTLYGV